MKLARLDSSILFLEAIIVLLLAGAFFVYMAVQEDPIEQALSGDRIINTLFVIENGDKPLSTFVLMYYPTTKRAAVFDIPGEIGLIISSINRVDRIDTLYKPKKYDDFTKEVGKLLGIDIPFSIVIHLDQLTRLVDLLEGIDLFIPETIEVHDGTNPILLPAGLVRLDGAKLGLYATYFIPDYDLEDGIVRRQRLFLALLKRLREKNTYLKQATVATYYESLMRSSMDRKTKTQLFDEFANLDVDRISVQRVGGNPREVSGQTLLFPFYDGSLIKEIVKQALSALSRKTEGSLVDRVFTVEVLNGTMSTGLASRTAELLRGFGYDVITIGNADRNDYDETVVIDHSGYEDMAKIFAEVTRCENLRFEAQYQDAPDIHNLEVLADFTIIIGKDFDGRYVNR